MALIWQTSTQISQIPTCTSCFSFTASFTVDIFAASCASFWASWWPANTAVSSGPVRWRSTNFEDGAFSVKPNSNRLKEIQQICLHHHFLVIYPHSWLLPPKFMVLECELYRFFTIICNVCVCCLHFFVQLLPQLCNNLISMSWLRQSTYRWKGSPPASAFCSWHADRKPFSSVLAYICVERCWYRWKSLKSQLKDKKKAGLLGFETLPTGFTIILHLGLVGSSSWLVWLGIWMYNDVQHCPIGPDCWVPMPAPPVIRGKTNESLIDTNTRQDRHTI